MLSRHKNNIEYSQTLNIVLYTRIISNSTNYNIYIQIYTYIWLYYSELNFKAKICTILCLPGYIRITRFRPD